jgi:hypothetical protein
MTNDEIAARDAFLRGASITSKTFLYQQTYDNYAWVDGIAWFTADQNYFVTAVKWSLAVTSGAGQAAFGVALKCDNGGFYAGPGGTYYLIDNAISTIYANAVGVDAPTAVASFDSFHPYGKYLEKGQTLKLYGAPYNTTHVGMNIAVTAFLVPTLV